MKDFKSYNPENNGSSSGTNSGASSGTSSGGTDLDKATELAKQVSKAMNGKNQGQLLGAIIAEAERGKRAGTLTNAELDNFYIALAPMVDGVKRKKLKDIIEKLKKI